MGKDGFTKIDKNNLLRLPNGDHVIGIVFHWTASRYSQFFYDYQFCVDFDGSIWQNNNADPGDTLSHTWHRNTGRVGIACSSMYNATSDNYGDYPWTKKQMEAMCALAAKIVIKYKIKFPDEVNTHAFWAREDGYFGERWDFDIETPMIKNKVAWYIKQLELLNKKKGI